ncbi:MAG: phytoene desaturase [Candidatus Heimdallarchaeota archaeon]|nr:phytoene desaturase [Candidatus Heimdallarchaeota archaeon]
MNNGYIKQANDLFNNNISTIIVIGSGFGGLAAGIRLQATGKYKVIILEKLDQVGGRARVFNDKGFTFDAGPTVITVPDIFRDLFTLAGRKMADYVDLIPVEPFYRIHFSDGTFFDYSTPEKNVPQIEEINPNDVEGYKRMLKAVKPIYEKGFLELSFEPFHKFTSMLKVAPSLIKLQSYRSNYNFVSRYIKNENLRIVYSFHPLLIGGNPYSVPSIYSLIQYLEKEFGVWFARGGTTALVHALAKLFQELGGKILVNSEIKKIEVENNQVIGVRTISDEFYPTKIVISNADPAFTYTRLIDAKYRKKNSDKRYKKAKYSMGLVVIYFGTKKQYPDMKHHTIILGPRYKGLLEDIFKRKVLTEDFSSYLHVPTRTDPSLAPEGHEAFYILIPVPHQDSEIDWEQLAEPFKQKIFDFLDEHYLPGLKENLVTERILTPLDFERDYNSFKGTGFSVEPIFTQSAWFRPHNKSEDIEGLYLVGAGTHPGAGLPGVVSSAKVTTDLILGSRDGSILNSKLLDSNHN